MSIYQEIPTPIIVGGGGSGGGSGTVSGVGPFATTAQGANGATISGSNIIFGPSDFTNPGMMSSSAQNIGGPKTFNSISTWNVPNLVLGTNSNIAISDSSSAFLQRSTGTLNTGMGASVFNKLTTGQLNTSFGWGNMTNTIIGQNNTVIGVGAFTNLTGGVGNIGIGYVVGAGLTNGSENIIMGSNAASQLNTGSANVLIGINSSQGANSISFGSGNVAVGSYTLANGGIGVHNICLGTAATTLSTTASNTLVVGGSSGGTGVRNGYFGNGVGNATPLSFTFNATNGLGTNIAGADLIMAAGRGTGTGAGGTFRIQSCVATSSGAQLNPLVDALIIDNNQNISLGAGAIATTAINGYPYMPVVTGRPTGTPSAKTGFAPYAVESTSAILFVYIGGAWKGAQLV